MYATRPYDAWGFRNAGNAASNGEAPSTGHFQGQHNEEAMSSSNASAITTSASSSCGSKSASSASSPFSWWDVHSHHGDSRLTEMPSAVGNYHHTDYLHHHVMHHHQILQVSTKYYSIRSCNVSQETNSELRRIYGDKFRVATYPYRRIRGCNVFLAKDSR